MIDFIFLFTLFTTLTMLFPALAPALPGPPSTADHGKFEQLKVKFTSGPEVTRACLECHTNAAKQIHKTKHWTWEYKNPLTGQLLGKKHVLNNFCIAAVPNIASCSKCHISYGWKDESFDFSSEEAVDCLVCHDTTGLYNREALRKPGKRRPKLEKFAQNVGPTSRRSCGTCHFAGGGAKAVKHGDIDPTLANPDYFVDVHMDTEGLDFTCSTCHISDQHEVQGSRYSPEAADRRAINVQGRKDVGRASCRSCHGNSPHGTVAKLNDHTDRIACQTCHIPEFSRGDYGSKMWWDWSTAGKLQADGNPFTKEDAAGAEVYSSKKGNFVWEKHTIPEYRWFNGTVHYTLLEDRITPSDIVPINRFLGDANTADTRIWPVKLMRGKQPYDTELLTLVAPLTTTDKGYWKTFDWDQAISLGMRAVNKPYSGNYGFVTTEMYWPITHMVAPAHEALSCADCHADNGRLDGVEGIYIPGRDKHPWIERLGLFLLLMTLAGVTLHGAVRLLVRKRNPVLSGVEFTRIYVFSRFERFWHWSQALLILLMLITGFEVHGSYALLGVERAMDWHTMAAWTLIGLWILAIFWHFTTGEWRQYIPSTDKLVAIVRYYSLDIFMHRPHPFKPSRKHKHNPLQRLAYLLFNVLLAPMIWVSGLLYLFYSSWPDWGLGWMELGSVAMVHTLAAYLIALFFVAHVYLISTGHTLLTHIKAMLSGWEEIEKEKDAADENDAKKPEIN
ncbi:MAG: tetrathionate reductase family octaheme c-type cytochrome [Proteobacteria bacterium]|nr:tetrathionate reductase family octaheme c-type cytochrome [Pseudomonadota bacterium]